MTTFRSKTLHAQGSIEEGVLKISHRRDFDAAIRGLGYQGPVFITIETGHRRRLVQNAYYWLMCEYISKQLAIQQWGGWDKDDVHEHNKQYCNAKTVTMVAKTGEIIDEEIPQSTTKLSVGGFAEYIDRCKDHWAHQGLFVPDTFE